jgi:hypothetical protein
MHDSEHPEEGTPEPGIPEPGTPGEGDADAGIRGRHIPARGIPDRGETLERARELVEEARIERRTSQRLALVLGIEELGSLTDDADLAQLFAEGLHVAALAEDGTPELRLALAERIGALRQRHDALPLAVLEARVLAAGTSGLEDPAACLDVARRIDALGQRFKSDQLAIAESIACFNGAAVSTDLRLALAIAERLGRLGAAFPFEVIARHESGVLVQASSLAVAPADAWHIEARADRLRERWPGAGFAEDHAQVLANAIDAETDVATRQRGMRQLRQLLAVHRTEPIALSLAHALYQTHGVDGDAAECRYAADEVRELNERFGSTGVALAGAQILRNGTAEARDAVTRRRFCAELEALVVAYPVEAIAAQVVHGLSNEFLALQDAEERAALLERMFALLRRFPEPEAAERASLALALEQQADLDAGRQRRRAALAHSLVAARPALLAPLRRAIDAVVGRTHDGDAIERVEGLLRG